MKLKITLVILFALTCNLVAQAQLSPGAYITDSGDTMQLDPNLRTNPFPPPTPLACASSNNHATPYNQNNGQRGIMFDITALNNIVINCFEVNMATGSSPVAIYYKVGTHVGFTTTPGAWTLIGTSPSIAGAGNNVPTAVPVPVNVAVSTGCTVAFYITRTTANGPLVNYTNGTVVGAVFSANADLQVKDGTGKDYPFAASFTPRRFNGTIFYTQTAGPGGGSVTGPTQVCAGASVQYTFTGAGWTSFNWTVPPGSTITSGQGTQTITVTAGATPGNVCCTPSGACGPGPQACLAVTLAPSPTSTQNVTNVSCNGGSNGSATINPNPSGTYTYAWSPNVGSTQTVTGLSPGTYTVTASNAGGCSTTQTITITQPPVLTATQSQTNLVCNGINNGSAQVNPGGGAGGYQYAWTPSGGTSATASNLAAGAYTCTITDANGCTNQQTFNITAPTAINLVTSSTPSTCGSPNGSASVVASGGAGGYGYAWSPSGGTAATENGLTGGAYIITVTDANNCTASATVNVTGATTPTATITNHTDILCNGNLTGDATVLASGGNGPYTYAWSPSGGTGTTENGLGAGTYTVTITDNDGCTSTDTITLTEPPVLTSAISQTDVLCFGGNSGTATMTPAGGAGGYQYQWSPSGGTAANATGLAATSYTCTVTDANGCTTTQSVTLTEPTQLTATTSQVDELCQGGNNGSATVNPSGGAGNYQYSWAPTGGNAATAPNIFAGMYTCTITDANGCLLTQTFNITEPTSVTLTAGNITHVDCYGNSTGSLSVSEAGGIGPYTFVWSPNVSTGNSASNVAAGNYSITVTDQNGCTAGVQMMVTEPPLLTMQTSANPSAICSGQNVSLNATPGGGAGGYNVIWNPGSLPGNPTVTPTVTTTYTATVTDANGCSTTGTAAVTVNPVPVAVVSSDITNGCTPICVNFADQSTVAAPGVINTWNWDFGDGGQSTQQNPTYCYTTPGQYDVILTIQTSDGCTHTVTMTNYIDAYVVPVAAFSASPQPTTIFNAEISFTDESSNAVQWNWSFGDVMNSGSTDQNPTFSYGAPMCYVVTLDVTSANGCTDVTSDSICIDPDVSIYVPNAFTPNGDPSNEIFLPICTGIDPQKFQLWIFDRWGNLIFYTTDINEGWDGRAQGQSDLCQIDTYVWRIAAADLAGQKYNMVGGVNLIR